ncbi:MAG: DUF4974 domain-containing protein [Gammaproteobacteria bacterium]|nr:DUF4974 domain-containing protein [Gammaproteobacteria bacterium]
MSNDKVITLPDSQEIEMEARLWVLRFDDGDLTEARQSEFDAWISQSAAHENAFTRLAVFWDDLSIVKRLDDYASSDVASTSLRETRSDARKNLFTRVAITGIAASIVAAVTLIGFDYTSSNRPFLEQYQTVTGEQETIALPDGSQIVLNTDSSIEVTYDRSRRVVRLERGEAYFDVSSDRDRQFSVETPEGVVTVVGTSFSLRLSEQKLDVTVEEGRVAVGALPNIASSGADNRSITEISAGQIATIDDGVESVSVIPPDALVRALDWRDGELSFNGETLEEVIRQIERYTNQTIEISDDGLKQQRIVAYYKIGDIERLFQALDVMVNVEVERIGNSHVRLYRSEQSDDS